MVASEVHFFRQSKVLSNDTLRCICVTLGGHAFVLATIVVATATTDAAVPVPVGYVANGLTGEPRGYDGIGAYIDLYFKEDRDESVINTMLQIIKSQLRAQKIKRNNDVSDLYLGDCDITEVEDLSEFRHLRRIWLHDNKLYQLTLPRPFDISFLGVNYRLSELYLQNNELKSIAGTLSHLSCLEVLMLQNNQLDDLDETLQELMPMHALRILNLFYNPLSQVKGYRLHLIHHLPSVTLLDRQAITSKERANTRQIYEEKQEAVKATVAFGRRSEGPPGLFRRAQTTLTREKLVIDDRPIANNLSKIQLPDKLEDIISERNLRRSLMQYTTLDWSMVPNGEERRLGKNVPAPQNITIRFR